MNKDLELEAEKYAKQFDYAEDVDAYASFIAGASSKWVEKQKLEFAIEQLKYVKRMYPCGDKEECVNVRIHELEQKLNKI